MAETQSIAPIGTDVSELVGGSSVFEHDRVVAQHDGIHEAAVGSSLVISRDPRFVGTGFFAGEAPDGLTTVYGDPIPADVFVYWRDQDNPLEKEVLVGAAKSSQDGTWRIMGLNYNLQYVIRARAQGYDDATVVGAAPSRTDVIAYVDQLVPREDGFGNADGLTGHVLLDSGLPPFTCEVIEPLPYGLSARVDGRKLLIEGESIDNGLWESVVRVTASNGVWVDVPVQVQIQEPSDLHLGKVSLLLHMDGADGSTTFTDSSAAPKTLTTYGSARISTAQSRFGGASACFDGGSYISCADSDAFNFAGVPWTIEFFVYWQGSSADVMSRRNSSAVYAPWEIKIAQGGVIYLLASNAGLNTWAVLHQFQGVALTADTFCHVALSGASGSISCYINGIKATNSATGEFAGVSSQPLYIGRGGDGALSGYLDEIRITRGVARYTENFTPPDKPFPSP